MYIRAIFLGLSLFFIVPACQTGGERPLKKIQSIVTHPHWSRAATIYEVNIRQYTAEGTFNAFRAHLPRLKKLGVDILWLMPVQPIGEKNRKGGLGSYYSIRDYRAVNPEFGTARELKALVDEAHRMGMYVILDWVANHTAWDHPWSQKHPDFYEKDEDGRFIPPVKDWTDVISLDYANKAMRDSMAAAMRFWIEEFNMDGFRCDVAEMVPLDFWDGLRPWLEQVKPVFMLAEGETAILHSRAFDMTYSWKLFKTFNAIAAGKKSGAHIDSLLLEEKRIYPGNALRMRFITNHDENSWNGTISERLGAAERAMAVLMTTLPGKPLLYSGQEVGQDKALRFFDKDTIDWRESPLTDFYAALFNTYRSHPALYKGTMKRLPLPGVPAVYAFLRQWRDDELLVLVNLSAEEKSFSPGEISGISGTWYDIFSDDTLIHPGTDTWRLPPWGYAVGVRK